MAQCQGWQRAAVQDVRLGLHKSQGTGFYKDDKTGKLFREEVARMPIMDGINDQAVYSLKISVKKLRG